MQTVAVLGYYGQGNFGDDLILEGLRTLFKGWEMQVYSTVTGGAYPTLDYNKANKSDLFIVGGGELIHKDCLAQPTPCRFKFKNHSLAYKLYNRTFLAHLPYLKHIKTRKVLLGCGVDAEELNWNVKKDLQQFSFIGLRDTTSMQTLKKIPELTDKIHLFHDLAFQLTPPKPTKKSDYAAVIPTHREGLSLESSEQWLKENVTGYRKAWLIPFGKNDNDDYTTARVLSPTLFLAGVRSEFMLPSQVNFTAVCNLLSGAKEVFTYRLNGLILAYMLGVPCRFYPYHPKLNRVHDTLTGVCPDVIRREQQKTLNIIMEGIN